MNQPVRVVVWNEFVHERNNRAVAEIYPNGIHMTLKEAIEKHLGSQVTVRTATLDQPEHGLTEQVLSETDVLIWWGHAAHEKVDDAVVDRIQQRVGEGVGLIVLHSGHYSKIFRRLMGTSCGLQWREAGEKERLWCVNPGHPIADGVCPNGYFELEHTEMYGELFDVPPPDELIFISWFEGGEVIRSGCTWTHGKGRIFYFRPGHETFPIYHDRRVQRVIANGVRWVAASSDAYYLYGPVNVPNPLSPITTQHIVDQSIHEPDGN